MLFLLVFFSEEIRFLVVAIKILDGEVKQYNDDEMGMAKERERKREKNERGLNVCVVFFLIF